MQRRAGGGAEWYSGERAEVQQRRCWDALQLSGICGRCGNTRVCPPAHTRPRSSSLFVRKDLSLVSFSAQRLTSIQVCRSPFEEIIRRRQERGRGRRYEQPGSLGQTSLLIPPNWDLSKKEEDKRKKRDKKPSHPIVMCKKKKEKRPPSSHPIGICPLTAEISWADSRGAPGWGSYSYSPIHPAAAGGEGRRGEEGAGSRGSF